MKVAAIDCGTNSIRLLVAEHTRGDTNLRDTNPLRDVIREMRIVRLGQGVDETGKFHPDALERTFAAAREYAELIESAQVERLRFAATSATRDATNREVFLTGIEQILGVRPEVISGEEEAQLSFTGAARVIPRGGAGALVVDLGGGSTEFVFGFVDDGGSATAQTAVSMDVGSVRITERHLRSDPPTAEEIAAAREDVRTALDAAARSVPFAQVGELVGTAGTITTVTAHALGLASYEPERINGARLTPHRIHTACEDLLTRSRVQRSELGFLHPGRIDVIGAGALIWQEIVGEVARQVRGTGGTLDGVTTSEHDVLDGLALSLL